jgi:hypothetical protein
MDERKKHVLQAVYCGDSISIKRCFNKTTVEHIFREDFYYKLTGA